MMRFFNTRSVALLSIAAAVVCALIVMAWYLSTDNMITYGRPYVLTWEAVSLAMEQQGITVVPGEEQYRDNFLVRGGAWCLRLFGGTYASLLLVQIPFLILLIISVSLIAWRYGGPSAAAYAAWLTLLGPTTIGLANAMDDHLALQALVAAALASLAWSDQKSWRWTAWLAIPLVALAGKIGADSTNRIIMLAIFACGAGGIFLRQWLVYLPQLKDKGKWSAALLFDGPWPMTGGLLLALLVGLWVIWPETTRGRYYMEQMHDEHYTGILAEPIGLLAYARVWFSFLVTPALAIFAVAALPVTWFLKKLRDWLTVATWLLIPMLGMSLIAKRQEYYLLAAVPATFVLIALGLAALPRKKWQPAAAVICGLICLFGWIRLAALPEKVVGNIAGIRYVNHQFLLAPKVPDEFMEVPPIGKWIAALCGPHRLLILSDDYSRTHWDSFALQAWHADPRLAPVDVRRNVRFAPERRCILTYFKKGTASTIAEAVEMYKRSVAIQPEEKYLQDRLNALARDTDIYRYAGSRHDFSIFIPQD